MKRKLFFLSMLLGLAVPLLLSAANTHAEVSSTTSSANESMSTPRLFHTTTLLSNGKVLVAGGQDKNAILASAELYDPTSGTWSTTGSMSTSRMNHTATPLSNGKILIAGGQDKNAILASAELLTQDTTVRTKQSPGTTTTNPTSPQGANTTAPTLQLPGTITVNPTSPQGTVVNYTVTATDPGNPSNQITITCTPPCSAQDPAGNTSTGSFLVVVTTQQSPGTTTANPTSPQGANSTAPTPQSPGTITVTATPSQGSDTTAPMLQLPGTITVKAVSLLGAAVNYTVTATDPDNPSNQITITCAHPSGILFPIGVTTVQCSAQDPAGNTSAGSFQVVVISTGLLNVAI